MKKTLYIFGLMLAAFPLFGQATTGYHRVSQVISRSNSGIFAQVAPFASVSVSDTATGVAAVIYSDPLLSSPIPSSLVTADAAGNYSYYMPLNTCNTETISSPGQSDITIPNICGNPASTVTLQTNGNNNTSQTLLNLVAGEGVVLENVGGAVTINAEGGSGVSSINTVPGAFTFSGSGVSCTSTTCTFNGFSNPMIAVGDAIQGGTSGNPVRLAGNATTAPDVIVSQGTGSAANPLVIRQLTQDDILPGFAISTFTCSTCATVEIGQTIASPTNFTASYTSVPTGASISDGTNTAALTTPFTSGSLAHSYVLNAAGSVTYTLTAVGPTTQTATQQSVWEPRNFAGVGTAGATGATASSDDAALAGATGTLSGTTDGAGLYQDATGKTFGPFSPSSQTIYLLLYGSGYKFSVNGFCTTFTATSVTFVNQYSQSVSLTLYEAPTTYTGTYNVAENPSCS